MVTVRDLRNHGGEVLSRVQAGETLTVTSFGVPVAELRPLPVRHPTTMQLIQERRGWHAVDPEQLRADIDEIVDQEL